MRYVTIESSRAGKTKAKRQARRKSAAAPKTSGDQSSATPTTGGQPALKPKEG